MFKTWYPRIVRALLSYIGHGHFSVQANDQQTSKKRQQDLISLHLRENGLKAYHWSRNRDGNPIAYAEPVRRAA